MVVVCCLESFLVLFDITVRYVAGAAQGHQVFYGISSFASAHTPCLYVVYVYGCCSA